MLKFLAQQLSLWRSQTETGFITAALLDVGFFNVPNCATSRLHFPGSANSECTCTQQWISWCSAQLYVRDTSWPFRLPVYRHRLAKSPAALTICALVVACVIMRLLRQMLTSRCVRFETNLCCMASVEINTKYYSGGLRRDAGLFLPTHRHRNR